MTGTQRIAVEVVRAPWSARTWLATGHVLVGVPVSLWPYVTVAVLIPLTAGLLVIPPLALGALAALLGCVRGAAAMQRSRFAAFLAVPIEAPPPALAAGTWRLRALATIAATSTWRQISYHLLAPTLAIAGAAAVVGCWSVGIALATAPFHGWPAEGIFGWQLRDPRTLATLTGVGLMAFFLAPWVARGAAGLDAAVARRLLGTSRAEELARRVESLAQSRAGAVNAADAERRRIERDLHDGTQQRLTSSPYSCCPSTSRSGTRPSCWPARPPESDTC